MKFVVAALAALAFCTSAANAAVFKYGGTVDAGQCQSDPFCGDDASLFGLTAFAGERFELTAQFSLTAGDPTLSPAPFGSVSFFTPLFDSVTLTVNGVTQTIDGGTFDDWFFYPGDRVGIHPELTGQSEAAAVFYSPLLPHTPYRGFVGTGKGSGRFYLVAPTTDTGYVSGNLTIDTFSMTGVPEPQTWTLLLLGFGGLGVTLRRRPVTVRG